MIRWKDCPAANDETKESTREEARRWSNELGFIEHTPGGELQNRNLKRRTAVASTLLTGGKNCLRGVLNGTYAANSRRRKLPRVDGGQCLYRLPEPERPSAAGFQSPGRKASSPDSQTGTRKSPSNHPNIEQFVPVSLGPTFLITKVMVILVR
jgi:hypothetical protein